MFALALGRYSEASPLRSPSGGCPLSDEDAYMQLALKTKGLRSRRRLLANVTGRRRELAHLRYRVSDQAENTGGLTTALTLDKNETSDHGIVVHGVHLLSPLCPPERGNLTGGRLYSATQRHKRRSSIGRLSHRPSQKYARLKVRQPPARAPARTCASSGSEAGHRSRRLGCR